MLTQVLRYSAGLALSMLMLASVGFAQSQIAGDWKGTLSPNGAELHLVFHITATKTGRLSATLDSVDQNAYGIPVTSVSLQGSKLTMAVNAVHGSYDGTVNSDGTAITGTWSQGTPLALNLTRSTEPAAKPAAPSDFDGVWLGSLNTGAITLRIVLRITNTASGLTVELQSPDQGSSWVKADDVKRSGASLSTDFKTLHATYEGKISMDGATIHGTFTQLGRPLPLTLKRVRNQSELERRRPQNPVKPYPYREDDVTFTDTAANAVLAGTLTISPGKGPFPAAVLISGSGRHDRDESLMGHKPFLVLADALTRKGILVLRYDKRGVGKSTGNYAQATTADFADDAEAGLRYLETRPEANPHRLGFIGHSEGGVIAPIVAARNRDVAFIVLLAGTGVPGAELLLAQHRLVALAAGVPPAEVERQSAMEKEILELVEHTPDNAAVERQIHDKFAGKPEEAQIGSQVKTMTSPWFRYFLTYDPATALRRVQCPLLALNGSLDLQVPPAENLPAIRQALQEGGNRHFELDEMPGLNHLFQHARTGAVSEYGEIEETMAPEVLDKIATWILQQPPIGASQS